MTPEERRQFEDWQLRTENRINFLVEHQADYEAKLEQTRELLNQVVLAQIRHQERMEQHEAQADHDRRVMREVVQDLKDIIALAHDKGDRANRRLDRLESA